MRVYGYCSALIVLRTNCIDFMIHTRTCTVCRANDIQQELDEYTENSAQLEKELEASLGQVEKQNRDLEHQNQRLKNEIEILRVRHLHLFRNYNFDAWISSFFLLRDCKIRE